jgi:hypothetical protein
LVLRDDSLEFFNVLLVRRVVILQRDVDKFLNLSKTNLEVEFKILKEKTLLGRLENGPHLISALEKSFHLLGEI